MGLNTERFDFFFSLRYQIRAGKYLHTDCYLFPLDGNLIKPDVPADNYQRGRLHMVVSKFLVQFWCDLDKSIEVISLPVDSLCPPVSSSQNGGMIKLQERKSSLLICGFPASLIQGF